MTERPSWARLADRLGVEAVADGDPTRWYDELWSAAGRGDVPLPWDRSEPFPLLVPWVEELGSGAGRRAVVVGCGLGADSEHLARHGWATTAFDISPSALAAVRARYPDSPVTYREGNLLDLADDLVGAFDAVVEIFTVQALHPSLREQASAGVRSLLAPGGRALVCQVVRADDEAYTAEPPWTLDRAEIEGIAGGDVVQVSLDSVPLPGRAEPLWRMVLERAG